MKAYSIQFSTGAGNPLTDLANAFANSGSVWLAANAFEALDAAIRDLSADEQRALESISCTLLGEVKHGPVQ